MNAASELCPVEISPCIFTCRTSVLMTSAISCCCFLVTGKKLVHLAYFVRRRHALAKSPAVNLPVHAYASSLFIEGTLWVNCLAAAKALGSPARRSLMVAMTSVSSSSGATDFEISPMRAASAAGKRFARKKADCASANRILGRHTTEIIAGASPSRTSLKPNCAVSTATEMSITAARPTPPAMQ